MGRRGPKPTPTPLLKLRGSTVPGRRGAQDEPVSTGLPIPPTWLSKKARKVWDSLMPVLDEMKVLGRIDAGAMARYCDASVRFQEVQAFLNKKGQSYSTVDELGNTRWMPYPQATEYHKLAQMLARLESEFGMTPSARTGVKVQKADGPGGLLTRQRA